MANKLLQIVSKAKKLYKSGRAGIKWKSAIKKAAAAIKKHGSRSRPVRKSAARRSAPRRSAKRASVTRKAKPVSTRYKNDVKQKLSKALLDYELADTRKKTIEAQKRKTKYRKILRAL